MKKLMMQSIDKVELPEGVWTGYMSGYNVVVPCQGNTAYGFYTNMGIRGKSFVNVAVYKGIAYVKPFSAGAINKAEFDKVFNQKTINNWKVN